MERTAQMKTPDVGDKAKTFHKGQVIYKEGQTSNEAYIIKQGAVGLYRIAGNKRVNLGILRPGQIFGEMGVITEEKRSASAEALDYTEVIVLDQNLLHTLLLKSPRPIQIITSYLVERVRDLNSRVAERTSSNTFASACNVILLAWKAVPKGGPKSETVQLSTVELSKTIKDILLITQAEIDDILDKLAKVHVIELYDVKGAYYRTDPLLGTRRKSGDFLKERLFTIPDVDRFASVVKNLARDHQDTPATELEFIDVHDFADMVGSKPETILRKIGYGDVPPDVFYFHKHSALAFMGTKPADYFHKAKRPRLRVEDLQTVDDIPSVDNNTLEEALSKLGFYKVAVLTTIAGDEAREKILKNLSKKIAAVVKDEVGQMQDPDPDEAADIEEELIETIKNLKGLKG